MSDTIAGMKWRSGSAEDLVVFLGPDDHGIALEVIGVELVEGNLLVIHAMKLRRRYLEDYARVMECQAQ